MSTIVDLYEQYGVESKYMYIFDRLFAPYRDSCVPKLEIGCGTGVKTHVMSEYFTAASSITGIDIDATQVITDYATNKRVTYKNVDATLEGVGFLTGGGTKYDVVIEDTWLDSATQLHIFENVAPYVASGGIYIIERFIDITRITNLQNLATQYGATCDIYEFDEGDQFAVMHF